MLQQTEPWISATSIFQPKSNLRKTWDALTTKLSSQLYITQFILSLTCSKSCTKCECLYTVYIGIWHFTLSLPLLNLHQLILNNRHLSNKNTACYNIRLPGPLVLYTTSSSIMGTGVGWGGPMPLCCLLPWWCSSQCTERAAWLTQNPAASQHS